MKDVLIVSSGPVGLTTATGLARHRVGCRIIERLAQPLPYYCAISVTGSNSCAIKRWFLVNDTILYLYA